ncbi:MAG: hypothetical protein IKK33_09245 [Lachnospiraceae bacterium]|nr:hypothetical protein [Lachnospiraceae bacterium]
MTNKTSRYMRVYSQADNVDSDKGAEIWLDKETGISYLFYYAGYEECFMPLSDEKSRTILKQLRKKSQGYFPWDEKRAS